MFKEEVTFDTEQSCRFVTFKALAVQCSLHFRA